MNPTLGDPDELRFDGSFESANLDCAVKVSSEEYDLFLRVDSNSQGHTQWFYFSVASQGRRKVQLNICNLGRSRTLYEKVTEVVTKVGYETLRTLPKKSAEVRQRLAAVSHRCAV